MIERPVVTVSVTLYEEAFTAILEEQEGLRKLFLLFADAPIMTSVPQPGPEPDPNLPRPNIVVERRYEQEPSR